MTNFSNDPIKVGPEFRYDILLKNTFLLDKRIFLKKRRGNFYRILPHNSHTDFLRDVSETAFSFRLAAR